MSRAKEKWAVVTDREQMIQLTNALVAVITPTGRTAIGLYNRKSADVFEIVSLSGDGLKTFRAAEAKILQLPEISWGFTVMQPKLPLI